MEGSLGEAKVVGGITTWGYGCDQPRRINPPGLFALPLQSSSQMLPPQRMGAWGGLPCILDIVVERTPSDGYLAATLVLDLGSDNGSHRRVGIRSTVFLVSRSPTT